MSSPRLLVSTVTNVAQPMGPPSVEDAYFAAISVPEIGPGPERTWLLTCREFFLSIWARGGQVWLGSPEQIYALPDPPLVVIDRLLDRLRCRDSLGLPFEGGLVGFLGYEALDPPLIPRHRWPDLELRAPWRFRIHRVGEPDAVDVRVTDLPDPDRLATQLGGVAVTRSESGVMDAASDAAAWAPIKRGPLVSATSEAEFCERVERCLAYIASGNIYQANLSHRLRGRFHHGAFELFAALREQHPTPHATFLQTKWGTLVGNSPELFLRRRGARVTTRPIKGTRPRGAGARADAELSRALGSDTKENAEHVMIVDLERNDLGRVARTGTVRVDSLGGVESFGTLHHMVSTITAEVALDLSVGELLRATFPGGSISGAPKLRAREVIRELETEARGPYTGATGWLDARGDVELAIAIRTALVSAWGRVEYRTGAGIVADSDPATEWRETLLKAEALNRVLATPRPPLWRERSRARRLTRGMRIE